MRKPDFENLLAVLENKKPTRPTLFEFFMNPTIQENAAGMTPTDPEDLFEQQTIRIKVFEALGYDYATVSCSFGFPHGEQAHGATISQNEGVMITNDDWGFKTQTMMSPDDMREYIIPWHVKISEAIHASGRPAILHSCGNLDLVMDDIIDVIGYDGKHSYEDAICPVEDAYVKWGDRIAILGGIDLDFICRETPAAVYERSKRMLDASKSAWIRQQHSRLRPNRQLHGDAQGRDRIGGSPSRSTVKNNMKKWYFKQLFSNC